MPATPADMPFLSEVEKSTYIESLAADWSGDAYEEEFSWSEVWSVFVDAPQILLGCLPLFFNGVTVSIHFLEKSYYAMSDVVPALWPCKLVRTNL